MDRFHREYVYEYRVEHSPPRSKIRLDTVTWSSTLYHFYPTRIGWAGSRSVWKSIVGLRPVDRRANTVALTNRIWKTADSFPVIPPVRALRLVPISNCRPIWLPCRGTRPVLNGEPPLKRKGSACLAHGKISSAKDSMPAYRLPLKGQIDGKEPFPAAMKVSRSIWWTAKCSL